MSQKNSISVVVPVYNEEAFMAACLDAVVAQSRPADEIIVVDNNSTDKTVEIARSYKDVTVINEAQQGVMFARATGLNNVSGSLIATIDADTRVRKDWLKHIEKSQQHHQWDGWSGYIDSYDIPDKTSIQKKLRWLSLWFYNWYAFRSIHVFSKYNLMVGVNMAITTKAWKKIAETARIQSNVWEDFEIAMALQDAGMSVYTDSDVVAGISSRSAYDTLSHNWQRLKLWSTTFRTHSRILSVLSFVFSYILIVLLALMQLFIPNKKFN